MVNLIIDIVNHKSVGSNYYISGDAEIERQAFGDLGSKEIEIVTPFSLLGTTSVFIQYTHRKNKKQKTFNRVELIGIIFN